MHTREPGRNTHTRVYQGMLADPGTSACGRNRGGDALRRANRLFGHRGTRRLAPLRFHGHQRREDHACPGQETPVTPTTDRRISQHPAPRRSWNSAARRSQKTPVASFSVRGPDRHWHRYAIFQDRIESVEIYGMSVPRHLGQQTLPVG